MNRFLSLLLVVLSLSLLFILSSVISPDVGAQGLAPAATTPVTNTITRQVQTSTDDTSVRLVTKENLFDWAYLRIGSSETHYVNGFRFQDVQIPPGSRILQARVYLYKGEWHKLFPVQINIQAEATDSARTFSNDLPLASERPRTAAVVQWEIAQPPSSLTWFESPDIAAVVQEVINRPGWQSGNALAIFFESAPTNDTDHYLDALSYDFGPAFAPRLEIVYESSTPVPTSTPTVTPTPTITPTPEPGRLAIERAVDIQCNAQYHNDTRDWTNNVITYTACRPDWPETGPEAVFRLNLAFDNTDVLLHLFPERLEQDLDLFFLNGAYPEDCLRGADASLALTGLDAGVYYVAVDGYNGAADAFTLVTSCQVHFENQLYLPMMKK